MTKLLPNRLVRPFRTCSRTYLYDSTSNNILQVSKQLYHYSSWQDDSSKMPSRLLGDLNCDVEEILADVNELAKRGEAFIFEEFPELSFPFDTHQIEDFLQHELRQLTLNVTEACNLHCAYCTYSGAYSAQRKHNSTYMRWNIAKRAIDFFFSKSKKAQDRAISFYGGEHSQSQLLDALGFDGSVEFPVSDTELITKHQDLKILVMVRYAADAD